MIECNRLLQFLTGMVCAVSLSSIAADSPEHIYDRHCAQCHTEKIDGAPRPGNVGDWADRIAQKSDADLLKSVINGLGTMPPRGTCTQCSDKELLSVVEWMKPADADFRPEEPKGDIDKRISELRLPEGFNIEVYAYPVADARGMALGDDGVLYVGTRRAGKLYAVHPGKKASERKVEVLADNLHMPHGVVFHEGDLYVAEVSQIIKYPGIDPLKGKVPKPEVVYGGMPKEEHHGWKTLHLGPDNYLYFPVGMPCNTCLYRDTQPIFGSIVRMTLDGKDVSYIAKGIRNSVGLDWNPKTGVLWFSDNGQDFMGDDLPPDEINRLSKNGQDFGFPYFYGNNVPSPGYNHSPKGMTVPKYNLPAHVAALGVHFYQGQQFPAEYQDKLLIAEHGSWNRSKKIGYRITALNIQDTKASDYTVMIEGWLQGQEAWGRPVAFLELPDGSLLISDDRADVIYRVTYRR